MEIKTWIKMHTELGTLRGKTGTRLINILNNTGVTYLHELEDIELRRFKGCGKKTFKLWNYLINLSFWSRHFPDLYRNSLEKNGLEERISELVVENSRLERALAKEKHFNSKTNYNLLREKLIQDNVDVTTF